MLSPFGASNKRNLRFRRMLQVFVSLHKQFYELSEIIRLQGCPIREPSLFVFATYSSIYLRLIG